jgi:hypothetical protein
MDEVSVAPVKGKGAERSMAWNGKETIVEIILVVCVRAWQ